MKTDIGIESEDVVRAAPRKELHINGVKLHAGTVYTLPAQCDLLHLCDVKELVDEVSVWTDAPSESSGEDEEEVEEEVEEKPKRRGKKS